MKEPQWFRDWQMRDWLNMRVFADNPECLQALEITERRPAPVAWTVEKEPSGLLLSVELRNIPRPS